MLTKPRWLLHLEGAAILVLVIFLYRAGHFSWGLLALLFLGPDLFILGYLIDAKWGAVFYNLVHTYVGPVVLLLISFMLPAPQLTPYGLIWLAHLGLDRMLGFGLKYPTVFKDTHLQHV
jgi:hypothetical protein